MTTRSERTYLPAAGHDWFLPLYDPLTRLLGVETARQGLIDQAALKPYQRVLDVGCGTGALAIAIKRAVPSVDVVAVDPDPRALARAQEKAALAGIAIQYDQGFAEALDYQDGSFDRVFSSMMFHHLAAETRPQALREFLRVLTPDGRLELLDFEGPEAGHGLIGRLMHSRQQLRDNSECRIVELLSDAGFGAVRKLTSRRTLFGRIAFYQADASATRASGGPDSPPTAA
jgi:ubiquinone/menaquinone biosynthesis C-methylase UbiE